MFFPTPDGYAFVQNPISYKKFPNKFFHKSAQISTYSPKTEFERFFPTPGGETFIKNSICYKKFFSQISHKMHRLFLTPGGDTFLFKKHGSQEGSLGQPIMSKKLAIWVLFALISTLRSQFFPESDQFILSRYSKNMIYVINQCIFTYKLYEDF